MNTKNLVLSAMLLGIGTVLYLVIPPFLGSMKPDFLLTMMFVAILLTPNLKHTVVVGLATGILSGLFTTFPGGFLPNVIDKVLTSLVFFAVLLAVQALGKKLAAQAVLTALGTALSGAIFLASATTLLLVPSINSSAAHFVSSSTRSISLRMAFNACCMSCNALLFILLFSN